MTFRRLPVADEPAHERAIRRVAEAVHRMNEAVLRAVEAGVSVELVRVSRHHDGSGNWGDQMIPMIREAPRQDDAAGTSETEEVEVTA